MDVFGNSSYIPDQAGWSQTGYMPTVNSFTATNTTNTWSQTPPCNVPWGISYSQALPSVIRFTGQSDISFPHKHSISSTSPHCATNMKRHFDDSDEDLADTTTLLSKPPAKQFISEEKMAAKMNEMHISHAFNAHNSQPSLFQTNTNCSMGTYSPHQPFTTTPKLEDLEEDMEDSTSNPASNNNDSRMPSLYLSEELKSLKSPMEPLVPQALLPGHLNSKALIVWTPRLGLGSLAASNPGLRTENTHPSSPESSEDEAEYIRSDDPKCGVVITEIHEPRHRSEEEMAVDDL